MRAALILLLLAAPVAAREPPAFDPAPLLACVEGGGDDCAGLAANACMEGEGGSSTVGMGFCLGAERDWWDARLNDRYQQVMTRAKAADAELEGLGSAAAPQAPALRDMQRAWIAYRDAACTYEATRWGGGTGAGPAAAQCALSLTARQATYLDGYLREGR